MLRVSNNAVTVLGQVLQVKLNQGKRGHQHANVTKLLFCTKGRNHWNNLYILGKLSLGSVDELGAKYLQRCLFKLRIFMLEFIFAYHILNNKITFFPMVLFKDFKASTLFHNGRNFSTLLFTCKLALLPRLRENIILNLEFKNEATRANLQENKGIQKWRPFWNKVYHDVLNILDFSHWGAKP